MPRKGPVTRGINGNLEIRTRNGDEELAALAISSRLFADYT